jgi:hypothetical protein
VTFWSCRTLVVLASSSLVQVPVVIISNGDTNYKVLELVVSTTGTVLVLVLVVVLNFKVSGLSGFLMPVLVLVLVQ